MNKPVFHFFIFAFFLFLGANVASNSWDGIVYIFVDDGESRNPAAVSENMDFSTLKGSDLSIASQKRILDEARILLKPNKVGIELGHFITRRENGKKTFACQFYDVVKLKFIARGLAENGESPIMMVEAPCSVGKTVGKIAPIWIPSSEILKESPGNMELNFNLPQKVSFRFDHIGGFWPDSWNLSTVTLEGEQGLRRLHIDNKEMLSFFEKPLNFTWKQESRDTASDLKNSN